MKARLATWWFDLRDTLWPIPAAMAAAAIALALLLVQVDQALLAQQGEHRWWMFSGGAAGARGVLAAIAATSMTVATMAFSITIVALQLGSNQYSPRILRSFTGDRGNQVVLGIFVATFVYALVVLRVIRANSDDTRTFVPGIAVTMGIVLAFVMIGALIYFFHHATHNIQAGVILDRATSDTRQLIEGEQDRRAGMTLMRLPLPDIAGADRRVEADSAGYLQNIDVPLLVRAATQWGGIVRVSRTEGQFLLAGATLATLWPSDPASSAENPDPADSLLDTVRSAFIVGMERTLERDIKFGYRQISDIALKALADFNDPTTSTFCIDRLGELLRLSMDLRSGTYEIRDDDDVVRVHIDLEGFETYLGIAFDQIRHHGAADMTVMLHLLEMLHTLAERTEDPAIRQHIERMAQLTVEEIGFQSLPEADQLRMLAAAVWAVPAPF
jgi:uncharacterized membrane protein